MTDIDVSLSVTCKLRYCTAIFVPLYISEYCIYAC